MNGKLEAIFEVAAANGEIIDTVLRKSSGVRAYDEAVQRAIQKSSRRRARTAPSCSSAA
jgi:hypothetical protein